MNPSLDPSQLPLRDIHLPAPIGWWPPAPGWWIVALLVAGLLVWAALRYRSRRPQRSALRGLASVAARLERGEDPERCLQQLSMLLRRFAMTTAADPAGVAGLTGERWLAHLDARWRQDAFRNGVGRRLATIPYMPRAAVGRGEALELCALCRDWVRAQRGGH